MDVCQFFTKIFLHTTQQLNKLIFILLFIPISVSLDGATYYLSPGGNDSNPGTLSQPFFSLNKAWTVVSAGDIIYLRGGTYSYTSQQRLLGKNGTSGNLIKVWAYPGETPLITRAESWSWSEFRAGVYFSGNYCHFKGIKISGFDQRNDFVWTALRCEDFANCILEFLDLSWSGLGSYMTGSCNNNLFLNCDWHDNWDPYTRYENADGLNFEVVNSGGSNTFRGCRFWNNSDDGLDLFNNDSYVLIENCWAWNNGYREDGVTVGGDGNGYKLGPTSISAPSTVLRRIVNCISYKNQAWGYNENGSAICNMEIYNNVSYNNSFGSNWGGGFNFNVSGIAYYIKNNISYKDVPDAANIGTKTNVTHNSWDGSYTVTNADFVSLDGSDLNLPRKSDGSLPDIDFLHLAEGSDLIDAGVKVGLTYIGNNPDLGPFEFQNGIIVIPVPVLSSAIVENSTPYYLILTYDLTLNNLIIPAISAFNVNVNSQKRTINSISISGTRVQLTLSSAIKFGDIVTLSYTKPAINPMQTTAGGEATNITSRSVSNNCKDPKGPNTPPKIIIKNPGLSYSGFVFEIDASGSYDPDNDDLTYSWSAPDGISIVSEGNHLQFLAPLTKSSSVINFNLMVSDGIAEVSTVIPVNIEPYKPEYSAAGISGFEASGYQGSDYPVNSSDENLSTRWSAIGDNQWLKMKLSNFYKISHLEIAFLPGQSAAYTFDILASPDSITWEPILINSKSWRYSGDSQVFDFPLMFSTTEYSFIKLVGHGNTLNDLVSISELKIFGESQYHPPPDEIKNKNVVIYPNPAQYSFSVSIGETMINPDLIRLLDFSGKIVFEQPFDAINKRIDLPPNLFPGIYIVELKSGNTILYTQNLLVMR
jgi:uncharacterized repeat protein (TIGR02059 family)